MPGGNTAKLFDTVWHMFAAPWPRSPCPFLATSSAVENMQKQAIVRKYREQGTDTAVRKLEDTKFPTTTKTSI